MVIELMLHMFAVAESTHIAMHTICVFIFLMFKCFQLMSISSSVCMCVCMRACMHTCMRVCMRECVRACCMCTRACVIGQPNS